MSRASRLTEEAARVSAEDVAQRKAGPAATDCYSHRHQGRGRGSFMHSKKC